MRLNAQSVTSFIYGNKEYEIDLAFDNVLDAFDVMNDKELSEHESAEIALALLLSVDKKGVEAIELCNYILQKFIEFEDKKPVEYDLKGNPMPVMDDEEGNYIDFEQDAEYIYASFRQAYGMNLFEQQGKLHWHEFKALLHGLPSNTVLRQIIQIRAWKPSNGDSVEQKREMEKLKKYHALRGVD